MGHRSAIEIEDRPMPYQHAFRDETRTPEKFTLVCERREDGGLRVTCPEVAGMLLSGDNVREVLRDVAPALHALLTHNIDRK